MALDWPAGQGQLIAGGKSLEWGAFGPDPSCGRAVIVMLHEGLGCLALWRDFPAQIARHTGHPVFAYSRAGYGQSDLTALPRPLDYMSREAVESLPDVLAATGADSYIMFGHSDGATIAAVYAGLVDDARLRGLILMAPHFFTEPMGLAEIEKARTAFQETDLKARMAKYHRDPEVAFRGWNVAWLDPAFKALYVASAIDSFQVPTLVLHGREDQYGTMAQLQEVEQRSPAAVELVVLEACRHSPQVDQPEATLAAVSAFMARLDRMS